MKRVRDEKNNAKECEIEKERELEKSKLQAIDHIAFSGLFSILHLIGKTFVNPKKALRTWLIIISVLASVFLIIFMR